MRVVLDTNVIISGLNFPGNEQLVLNMALLRRFDLFLSPFILQEVRRVLARKFRWDNPRMARVIEVLSEAARIVTPTQRVLVVEGNLADNRILECAADAEADYLVTGDRRHLLPLQRHANTRIVTAAQFLSVLEEGE